MDFRHEPLLLSGNSIRLFQIEPAAEDKVIRCTIKQYPIHNRPPSIAVSYTWDDEQDINSILLNGKNYTVRKNLWELLQHMEQFREGRHIWIDALCIDQGNVEEKNFQVQLMTQIYERADFVMAWLGPASEDSARAITFIEEMALYQSKNLDVAFQREYLLSSHEDKWQCVINLFQRPYWTRTWIIQEFLLARYIEVVCGTIRLQWKLFEEVVKVVLSLFSGRSALPLGTLPSIAMKSIPFRLTRKRVRNDHNNLESLVLEFHDSQCTQKRDKIYGMLGIAEHFQASHDTGDIVSIKPDYSKDMVEVYYDALHFFASTSTLNKIPTATMILLQKTLSISSARIAQYAMACADPSLFITRVSPLTWQLIPDYVSRIREVLKTWSNPEDLRTRLQTWNWRPYVGTTTRSLRKPKSPFVHKIHTPRPIPTDIVDNIMDAMCHSPRINSLHNYPEAEGFCLPFSTFSLPRKAKNLSENSLDAAHPLPSIIFEHNNATVSSLRLGFACTAVQQNDHICQFQGFDSTLIIRKIGDKWKLVGKAVMMKHNQLKQQLPKHPVCEATPWFSQCIEMRNPESVTLKVDTVSFMELMS